MAASLALHEKISESTYQFVGGAREISDLIAAGENKKTTEEKQSIYHQAFKKLKEITNKNGFSSDLQFLLSKLLFQYGKETHYNIGKEGFTKCARLMELSYLFQLVRLDLVDFSYPWTKAENIEALITLLHDDPTTEVTQQAMKLIQSVDGDVLLAKLTSHQDRVSLAMTVQQLAFSHQNIPKWNVRTKENFVHHQALDQLAYLLFINDLDTAEYAYNRCGFMIGFENPEDFDRKIASYVSLIERFEKLLKASDSVELANRLHQKRGQCLNMQAILTEKKQKTVGGDRKEALDEALKLWDAGLHEYLAIAEPSFHIEYLTCNLYSSYAFFLVERFPDDLSKLQQAVAMCQKMGAFIARAVSMGKPLSYFEGYQKSIEGVMQAAGKG